MTPQSGDAQNLYQRRENAVPRGPFHVMTKGIERAEGAHFTDVEGNRYIDFVGGIGTMNVGHSNPRVLAAMKDQMERFVHTSIHTAPYPAYVELAERLNQLIPITEEVKTAFFNAGAEAVENAVKIARAYTGRNAVIAFDGGFHGRTMGALSMTGEVDPYRSDFGPMLPYVYHIPYPYTYRNPFGISDPEQLTNRLISFIEQRLFPCRVSPSDVACVIMEPVLGEGGFVVPPKPFLRHLKALCEEHGILFICDEVQAGFGRTGRMFATEHFGIEPDLVVLAKSLAAGMPLSAVSGKADIMEKPRVGALGGTYGGNPVACAGALGVLDVFEEKNLVERAREIGDTVKQRFKEFEDRFHFVGEARGLGAMRGLELVSDPEMKSPDPDRTSRVLENAHENGLAIMNCGIYGNVIRTLMPLVIEEDDLIKGLDILEQALESS